MISHSALELKYDIMANNINEIIIFFEKKGLIVDCNKAAKNILGYGDEILKMCISDIFIDAVSIQDNCMVIDSKYNNIANEASAYRKNGTCISVELKIIIREVDNIGLCIASDITREKKLTSKVKHLRNDMRSLLKMKDIAVTNIVHELRTPICGIMGMSELLMDMELNSEQRDNVDIIYSSCKKMNDLINDLFDIVRMKENKPILKEDRFDIYQLIDRVTKSYMCNIQQKQLKLIVNISEDIPVYLIGDEFRLSQIIDNLLSNAIKFTDTGEIVLNVSIVTYTSDVVELVFAVIDTGIGISAKDKDKIFMSYYQADGSISKKYGGVGLGLSICKTMVKAMGGSITVDSVKDKGSKFSFTICVKNASMDKEEIVNSSMPKDLTGCITLLQGISKSHKDVYIDIPSDNQHIIERLTMAIRSDDWKHAGQLASILRDSILNEDKTLANKVLQLLFSIRKEDQELCIKKIEELGQMI